LREKIYYKDIRVDGKLSNLSMDIKSALNKLFSLHQFGIKLGLENITDLLDQIGNPHKDLKSFHIAGSNGKGSTASFIASIMQEAGYKVGLYTSPHFVKFNERIRINGRMIDDGYIAKFVSELEESIDKNQLTFFEVTTALAFKYFNEQKVDYTVIETGLGGRLDATNVINPIASVITSISLEHVQYLGNTIEKIAYEKGGIIKPNTFVFTGAMPEEAEKVIRKKSDELNCRYFGINSFIKNENDRVLVLLNKKEYSVYSTPLRGAHQLYNSALAVKVINKCLGIDNGIIISRGISNVKINSGIEGRYEVVNTSPRIIFDSAHNPEGVQSFVNEFAKEYETYKERILIFGAMKDKNVREMLKSIHFYFHKIFITEIKTERSAKFEELEEISDSLNIKVNRLVDMDSFIKEFKRIGQGNCLIVLGSIYLLGEIKSELLLENP
jgi:dihydrofolate synthase / folylpolyglutamate synthase